MISPPRLSLYNVKLQKGWGEGCCGLTLYGPTRVRGGCVVMAMQLTVATLMAFLDFQVFSNEGCNLS